MKKINIEILAPTESDIQNELINNSINNVEIELVGISTEKGFSGVDLNSVIEATISLGSNVLLGVLGNFIYDCVKGKAKKIWINSKKVDVDKDEIIKAISQEYNDTHII